MLDLVLGGWLQTRTVTRHSLVDTATQPKAWVMWVRLYLVLTGRASCRWSSFWLVCSMRGLSICCSCSHFISCMYLLHTAIFLYYWFIWVTFCNRQTEDTVLLFWGKFWLQKVQNGGTTFSHKSGNKFWTRNLVFLSVALISLSFGDMHLWHTDIQMDGQQISLL